MKLDKVRRLAAGILKEGKHAVWLNPAERARIAECMTKDDVRGLIKEGIIRKRAQQGHSRGMARILHRKKKMGRKRGFGKRKGGAKARTNKKRVWVKRVRAQRKTLKEMAEKGIKTRPAYSKAYRMIKSGHFRGKRHVEAIAKGAKK